jgi:hypothetical protein
MPSKTSNISFSPLKSWLAEFLLIRDLYKGPNSRPLYSYQVTAQEYEDLRKVLTAHRQVAFDYPHEDSWAACFCLYVSECFRREYDGGESGWAWATFEKRLSCTFNQQQHAQLVTTGLEGYWKRPIRQRERGRELLGSLFAEGGLPWLLVQSESHGFGRSVRKGLRDFYYARQGNRTTADLMADSEQYLPQIFRNLETRQLLAGIVEQLMYLAEQYPLREQTDPSAYLDQVAPRWRGEFPIPLDETNARGLINDWLKDAGQRSKERKEEQEKARAFTCTHGLIGELDNWGIQTDVLIPREVLIPLGERRLNSTRMEIYFYEGERQLAKGGVIYGQLKDGNLSVRFPMTQLSLRRSMPQQPLTMRLLENGNTVHVLHFANSMMEFDDLPLTFEPQGDDWQFVSSSSCSVTGNCARIRLPPQFEISGGAATEVARDKHGGRWIVAMESLRIQDNQNLITVSLNQTPDEASKPELQGNCVHYSSTPAMVYLGWPRLLPGGATGQEERLAIYANGREIAPSGIRGKAGKIRYSVRNARGELILHRRFGVLPEDFQLSLLPAVAERPAQLRIRPSTLKVGIVDSCLRFNEVISDQTLTIQLHPTDTEIPTGFSVAISNSAADDPVVLQLPFPYQGARLIGADGAPLHQEELTLEELAGVRISLSAGRPYGQQFAVQMELVGSGQEGLTRQYFIDVGNMPVLLSLFSYQNDIAQMLGAVDEQDAYIRLSIGTEKRLLSLNIRRYNGQVRWLGSTNFEIVAGSQASFRRGAKAEAMLLSDPRQAPINIQERQSEEIGTGVFQTTTAMERDTPWLIYPGKDSAVKFRPIVYTPDQRYLPTSELLEAKVTPIRSMHEAARIFHPQYQPDVIDKQIASMAVDFDHSGWQYLADLKSHYGHLPLSTFESWRALARHPEALATAVFRLELDEVFCGRMRDELAVIWECTPLPLWSTVYQRFRDWLTLRVPNALQRSVLENFKAVLPAVVSGFQYVDNYLETGDTKHLRKAPVQIVLPDWYQSLRRTHEANDYWPTELGALLSAWIQQKDLPEQIKRLSQITYSDAVTYLPIFMAYITAGKAQLNELPVRPAYLKFAIKMISDFDRSAWYACVHAMMVSYLLASDHRY